jgi:hypothetical protein
MFSFTSPPLTVVQDLVTFGVDASVDDVALLRRSLCDHHHPEERLRDACDEAENWPTGLDLWLDRRRGR